MAVISHGFILHFPNIQVEKLSTCLLAIYVFSFASKSFVIFYRVVCHIVHLWEFFIYFVLKPLSDTCVANIVSQSVSCLFISLTVPLLSNGPVGMGGQDAVTETRLLPWDPSRCPRFSLPTTRC